MLNKQVTPGDEGERKRCAAQSTAARKAEGWHAMPPSRHLREAENGEYSILREAST